MKELRCAYPIWFSWKLQVYEAIRGGGDEIRVLLRSQPAAVVHLFSMVLVNHWVLSKAKVMQPHFPIFSPTQNLFPPAAKSSDLTFVALHHHARIDPCLFHSLQSIRVVYINLRTSAFSYYKIGWPRALLSVLHAFIEMRYFWLEIELAMFIEHCTHAVIVKVSRLRQEQLNGEHFTVLMVRMPLNASLWPAITVRYSSNLK